MTLALAIGLLAIPVIVTGWYAFEGRWNRRLFHDRGGHSCRNCSAAEARDFLQAHPDAQVVDVRSSAEFRAGALPGAIHISVGDSGFAAKVGALSRSRPLLVYCAGGYRSRKAVELMKPMKFTTIQHLHRGYHSWKLSGLPVTRPLEPLPEP